MCQLCSQDLQGNVQLQDLDLPQTRSPKLDSVFKSPESRFAGNLDAKLVDADLIKIQSLMLDVLAPLLELLAITENESNAIPRPPHEVVSDAIMLLENAVAHTSKLQRKRVLKACNPDIQNLADEEGLFANASPTLFGLDFEKKMKKKS